MDNPTIFVERPLTEKERLITIWLLQHGNPEALTFLSDVERATVVRGCPCGCPSIDFAIAGVLSKDGGIKVLSDYYWINDDDHTNGIFVYSISGQLAGLEVYSCDGECSMVGIPDPIDLIPMSRPLA